MNNPLNLIPTSYRILAAAIAVALTLLAIFALGWSRGADSVQVRWDKAKALQLQAGLEAEQAARHKERSMQQKLNEAQHAATERQIALRADYAAAHAAAYGLRDTVAVLRGQLSAATDQAARAAAITAAELLGECSSEYRSLAAAADGHAADAEACRAAWPE